jgi:esterase/lipase
MNTLHRILSVIKTINGLSNQKDLSSSSIVVEDMFYPGLDNQKTPLKIFHPNYPNGSLLILYPGATIKGESHPKMVTLARSLAINGVKVFLPRIPPLIDLKLTEDILLWTVHFYKWVFNNYCENHNQINIAGVSFGGVIVLKSCLDPFLIKNRPKSVLVFGTSFDARTTMEFMFNGKIIYNDKVIKINPDPWSIIVMLHNYLNKVNTGYDTKRIEQALTYYIHEKTKKFDQAFNKLDNIEKNLINDALELNISDELKRVMNLIINDCSTEIDFFSARTWCNKITNSVFIIHGKNDSLSPFTESIKLHHELQNSNLLISELFEHREISRSPSYFLKIKEMLKIVIFLSRYYKKAFSI